MCTSKDQMVFQVNFLSIICHSTVVLPPKKKVVKNVFKNVSQHTAEPQSRIMIAQSLISRRHFYPQQ